MNKEMIRKYAELVIKKGVNLQKNQTLIINTSVYAQDMTRACVEEAYKVGAKEVIVNYKDEGITRMHYMYQDVDTLCTIHPFEIDSKLDYLKEGACLLHILSEEPGIFKGLDAEKIGKAQFARASASKEAQEYTMLNKTQWCIAAVPNVHWAKQVFPDCEDESAAVELLWEEILGAVHVKENNDPIASWKEHDEKFRLRSERLNEYAFTSMHFTNGLGTDLNVGLVKNHIWAGGSEFTNKGIEFNANMPTEEIFTMPQRDGVDGIVYASRPLLYNGELIEDFWFRFKDGKVVEFDSDKGIDALRQLVHFDEGSCHLGEVALVPYDSPISKSGVLFLNTLFDENASCHLALGDAYPSCVAGGEKMSEAELKQAGGNHSMTHVDFMFGTEDMKIVGKKEDGSEITVFDKGNFVI